MSDPLNVDFYNLNYREVAPLLEQAAGESNALKEALRAWAKAQDRVNKAFARVEEIVTARGDRNFGEMESQFRGGHMDMIEKISGYKPPQQEIE